MRAGIDLGTTYCAIAYVDRNGKAQIIKNKLGEATTPSVLFFAPDGRILHGEEAKTYVEEGSEDTASYFKYHMGDPNFSVIHNGKAYLAEDLSAELLKGIVREAQEQVHEKITEVVITVPAYFDHAQRMATRKAGRKAGLKVLNIINEPTAAAFAYGINGKGVNRTILVYDLGGGTFDVTIAQIMEDEIHILGTDGDHRLGGKDWDDALAEYLAQQFEDEFGEDPTENPAMNISLQALAERTKKQLTSRESVPAIVRYGRNKGTYEITEELFSDLTSFQLRRTTMIIEKLMKELSMKPQDIDGVLLVGGSTRMKQVSRYLKRTFGSEPLHGINVDEAVALGAAIRANIDREGRTVRNLPTLDDGSKPEEPQLFIAGAKKIRDATAHSMGMIAVSKDGSRYQNSIMIAKNSEIPSSVTRRYALDVDKKKENRWEVYMLQGEQEQLTWPLNVRVLGKYVFSDIRYQGRSQEELEITYSYDEDNVVQLKASQDGRQLPMTIEPVDEDMSWVAERPGSHGQGGSKTLLLAIDLSWSMKGEDLEEAKEAAVSFVEQLDMSTTRVGLILYADAVRLQQAPIDDKQKLISQIRQWECREESKGGVGICNDAHPFDIALQTLKEESTDVKYILVLTDGLWGCKEEAIRAAGKCHERKIEVIAMGFGAADRDFLAKIASQKDFASFLSSSSQLAGSLSGIARML